MKQLKFMQITALLLVLLLIFTCVPVMASANSDLLWISFDDAVTNSVPQSVTLSGSENNRVIDFNEKNKALSLSTGFIDNEVSVNIPDLSALENYVMEFELSFTQQRTSVSISMLTAATVETELLRINSKGSLTTVNDKKCGGFGLNKMNKVAVVFNKLQKTYSVYFNDKCVIAEWNFSVANYSSLKFTTSGENKSESYLLLDNIRFYEGTSPRSNIKNSVYNESSMEFVPVDEANVPLKTYANISMDDQDKVNGVTMTSKTNSIEHEFEGKNGFLRLQKLDTSDSLYIAAPLANTGKQTVLEYDIRLDGSDCSGMLFYLTDNTGASAVTSNLVSLQSGMVVSGGKTASLSENIWHTVTMIFDTSAHVYDLYVDHKILVHNAEFTKSFKSATNLRIFLNATSEEGMTDIDNIKVYEGDAIRDLGEAVMEQTSIFSDKNAKTILSGNTALSPYVNKIYFNGVKTDTDVPCIVEGDEALVSADTFEKLFGVKPSVSGNSISAGSAMFIVGEKAISIAGKKINISVAPQTSDNGIMLPADAYGKNVLGDKYYNDLHGMLLVSNRTIDIDNLATTSPLRDASRFMLFDRYSATQLVDKMKQNLDNDLTKHPRILATKSDIDRIREEIKTDRYKKQWAEAVFDAANTHCNAGKNAVIDYDISTGRLTTDSEGILSTLSMAYQLSGDKKYAQEAILVMEKVCSYPDWYPDHQLGTSDIERGVAIGFDWCYDAMTQEQRESIYTAAKKRGLVPNSQVYNGTATFNNNFWGKTDTNWGGVVNSGAIELCLATMEMDVDYNSKILEQALLSIEYPISCVAPDGAWHEGAGYWSYFLTPLGKGMAAYESAIGETFKGVYQKGMIGMCEYQSYITDPMGCAAMYNDMGKSKIDCSTRLYIADKLGENSIMKSYTDFIEDFGNNVNSTEAVASLLWYDTAVTDNTKSGEQLLDGYFRDTELMTMRQTYNDDHALWVMADGGDANASHSHLDTGSFQFALDGYNWAIDLGSETGFYSRDGKNYAVNAGYTNNHYYRRKMEGHNCVVINPDKDIEIDKKAFAKMNEPVSGVGRAYASIDLTDVYTASKVKKYTRGYLLSEGRRALTVRDEIELAKNDSEVWWFMHTDGDIYILDNNTALITHGDKQLKMQFVVDGSQETHELMSMPQKRLIDLGFQETVNNGEKVALKLKASGTLNITVKMTMINDPQSLTAVETTPISEWSVEGDNTIAPTKTKNSEAKLKGLKINGVNVNGFQPDNYTLSYSVEKKDSELTVEPLSDYRFENTVISSENGISKYQIKVYDDAGLYTVYNLKVEESEALVTKDYNYYSVVSADVSSEQTTATTSQNNLRAGSYDRDILTRWSASGDGEWIVHDLGEVKVIDAVGIVFYSGASRTYGFDIQVSEDGVNFTDVLMGKSSSGSTNNVEIYTFPSTVNARYVKFIGHGSNTNAWNNVVELMSLVKKVG